MSSRPRRWRFRLRHIIEAIEKIHTYVEGMSLEDFLADPRTSDAVLRNLEIHRVAAPQCLISWDARIGTTAKDLRTPLNLRQTDGHGITGERRGRAHYIDRGERP